MQCDTSVGDFDQLYVRYRTVVVNSGLMGQFDCFGQVRERSIISASNVFLRDRMSTHLHPLSDTKNVEIHVVKYNEDQTNVVTDRASLPHYLQGLVAGRGSFVNEAISQRNHLTETLNDSLPSF